MKELLLSFFFALVAGSAINGYIQSSTPPAAQVDVPDQDSAQEYASPANSPVVDATDASFQSDVLKAQTPVLVDFWAEWCGPCKAMAPTIDQLAIDYANKLKVVRVDVDANEELSNQYQVTVLPTFMVFKDGKRVDAMTGGMPRDMLEQTIKKHLN